MEKVLIEKNRTFEQGLFAALATLEPAGFVEVCGSSKAYSQDLVTKWNKKNPDGPNYKVKTVAALDTGKVQTKVLVLRTK